MLMRRKAIGLGLVLALTGAACAGDVVRYHDASVGPDGVTILASGAPGAKSDGGMAGTGAVGAADSATTDMTAAPDVPTSTEGALPATPGGAAASTTPVSGPASRTSRPSPGTPGAAGTTGSGAATSSGRAGPATSSAASPTGPGTAGSGGGGGPATPAGPVPDPGVGGTTIGVTKDTITIGVFYPKTGAYAGIARNGPAVVEAAFNEAGLINGRRLVAKYYDDGTANASTIQVEEKRAKDEVLAMFSFVGEANVVLAPLADKHKVPLIVGNIDRKVALPLSHVFAVYPYWAHQATILPSFIKNVLGGGAKKIGIVYEGTSTAIDAKQAFRSKAKELGLNVTFEQPIAQNQSTCVNEVSNLQSRGVEVVFMLNGPLGGICMLRDARALGYKPTWTGIGTSWGFNIVSEASGGSADGVRMLRATPTLESPEGRHYTELMRKAAPNSGADTDDLLLIAYALIQSFVEGLRRAGPDLTREGLVQTWETKMNGYESGYLPPPTFGPDNRSGPLVVGVSACCTNNRWTTPQQGWRATF
jgi:branched-chain amino acid transport system substrate-binding protein